jgi:hypothetical protein
MNIYYVYEYLREDMTPYYVGKGCNNRWQEKHNVPVPPKERVRFVAENLDEQSAFDLEIELIAKYGRKDLGTGILRNLTDGGDGTSGYVYTEERKQEYSKRMKKVNAKRKQEGWEYPKEAREYISSVLKGIPKPKEHVAKVAASLNARSEEEKAEWKAKIAATKVGKPRDEATKEKLRAAYKKPEKIECCGKMYDPGNLARHRKGQLKHKCQLS